MTRWLPAIAFTFVGLAVGLGAGFWIGWEARMYVLRLALQRVLE